MKDSVRRGPRPAGAEQNRSRLRRREAGAIVATAAALLLAGALALALALFRERRSNSRLRRQLDTAAADLQFLQDACSRLAPAGLVQQMVADGTQTGAAVVPEFKIVTALFADLVGYTAMSERLEPTDLARVLNGYFQRMSDAIHGNRGHVSTFLGDGILAYFGALRPNPWQCDDAVRAALADAGLEQGAGDRAGVAIGVVDPCQLGDVLHDRVVELEQAAIAQLQDRDAGHRLGDRSPVIDRPGIHRDSGRPRPVLPNDPR